MKTNYKLKKEIRSLKIQNKKLQNQLIWLAKQTQILSEKYAGVTYGGMPIYKKHFETYIGWVNAAKTSDARSDEQKKFPFLEFLFNN